MGVMSRRVLPICGGLCFFCPSLRSRSRQPVKRYKKLLEDALPKVKDGEPNDRMISKLTEYALMNPVRIPKITTYLDQKFYKELRNEHFAQARAVLYIYRKLLGSCKEHMPLFAPSLLCIARTLLEQTRQDEMRILGCETLIDFLYCQIDSTHMFNVEGFIPKLCQLGREIGRDDMKLRVRSAGLQALSCMVQFMGDHSHISNDFDEIVSVTLENCVVHQISDEYDRRNHLNMQHQNQWSWRVNEEHLRSTSKDSKKVLTWPVGNRAEMEASIDKSKSPSYWSKICLHNMAKLAKEATMVRRVLEPMFRSFDNGEYWSPDNGVAYSVLLELQNLMDKSGQKSYLLISMVIKHLEHKSIAKRLDIQTDILKVATHLAQDAKVEASLALTTAISDLIKHLRKCMQYAIEATNLEYEESKRNSLLHLALEECLIQLTKKAGDIGPILDMMAIMLENIPSTAIGARTMISSVHRSAQIAASIPYISSHKKVFPEALFHQLLLAMAHPDHDTRVASHRLLSVVLVPSAVFPWSVPVISDSPMGCDPSRTLAITLSGFSSPATMLEAVGEKQSMFKNICLDKKPNIQSQEVEKEKSLGKSDEVKRYMVYPSYSVHQSVQLSQPYAVLNGRIIYKSGEKELASLRLSSHQVGLLLSSIWVQATSEGNTPSNFEALAHSFNLALLFSRAKASRYSALVRCFQLAFSLWDLSHAPESSLQPSRRRSLLALSSAMIIFSAKAVDLSQLIPSIKDLVREKMVDPYLHLVEDGMLQAFYAPGRAVYGLEDDATATSFLATIQGDEGELKRVFMAHLMEKFRALSEEEQSEIKLQLMRKFSPDDAFPFGAPPSYTETPYPSSPIASNRSLDFDGEVVPSLLAEEVLFRQAGGNMLDLQMSEFSTEFGILSVGQLIESVIETTREVANSPIAARPIPYDQMKTHCEAVALEKQQKMSALLNFRQQQQQQMVQAAQLTGLEGLPALGCRHIRVPDLPFKLPPHPGLHDKILSAA